MDPRTQDGELLWPELFPEERVAKMERELRSYGTAGQFQQRPAPEGGGMFQRAWFPRVKGLPATDKDGKTIRWRWRRSWDVAATEGGGCYTTGVLIGDAGERTFPRFWIHDVKRGQWSSKRVNDEILQTAKNDGRNVSIREEQEPGSSGKTVVEQRRLDLAGYDYASISPSGDKEVRAGPLAAQAEAGNVALVEGPWVEDFLQELEVFPNGAYLDQTDAAAHGFNDLMTGARPVRVVRAVWG
jgi:predicted phage terminase large subunit-like protein